MKLNQVREYINIFLTKNGEKPSNIPLTKIETFDVVKDASTTYLVPIHQRSDTFKIFDTDIYNTPFAEQMREKRLEIPVSYYLSECELHEALAGNVSYIQDTLIHRLKVQILSDITELELTFEVDLFATIKRALRITKWFPIKQKKVRVDCKILYPYCKVNLPHNKHVVKFYAK